MDGKPARGRTALLKAISQYQTGFHALTGDFNTLAPGELLDFSKVPEGSAPSCG